MPQFIDDTDNIDHARSQWQEGATRLERFSRDDRRRVVLEVVVDRITAELDRRLGQTFTMLELVQAWEGAEPWCLELVHDAVPEEPWAWDLGIVQDATFARHVLRAQDYQP